MKIQRFLIWIQDTLLNYPDISFTTVKRFIQGFKSCLSKKELQSFNNSILLEAINDMTLKQISLDRAVLNSKINNLDIELNNLKNGN